MTLQEKISCCEKYLTSTNKGIRDEMKEEIHLQYFDLGNGSFDFLNSLNSKEEIENKIDLVISKMILHEHEDGLETIMNEYFS